jgi:pimeloyl-ACP methyl ester carboxylesterase
VPFDSNAYARALLESQVRKLRGWVVEPGTFQVATKAGHFVHRDDPEVVVAAIRHLVNVQR